AASSTAVTSSLNPSITGQAVIFTASVTPSSATGTITFNDAGSSIGIGTLSGGAATLNIATLSVGTHLVTASYAGDANNVASNSSTLTQAVNKAPTTTTLTSAPNPSTFGAAVTLTATVTPSSATRTVTFTDGATT